MQKLVLQAEILKGWRLTLLKAWTRNYRAEHCRFDHFGEQSKQCEESRARVYTIFWSYIWAPTPHCKCSWADVNSWDSSRQSSVSCIPWGRISYNWSSQAQWSRHHGSPIHRIWGSSQHRWAYLCPTLQTNCQTVIRERWTSISDRYSRDWKLCWTYQE